MLSVNNNDSPDKKKVQEQVIKILNEKDYSLKVNNRYKENLIHVCATNNCVDILKCILQKHDKYHLEKKNAFGWTPLMQAVRNENMEMVKFLLSKNVVVNDFSYLGMSILSLACAISMDMFDLLINNCPDALKYAAHDDINPLCVAALKNDEELFFKLVHHGLNLNDANDFTQLMMKQSSNPKISVLSKSNLPSEDYWNDLSEIESLICEVDDDDDYTSCAVNNNDLKPNSCVPEISFCRSDKASRKKNIFNNSLETIRESNNYRSVISPRLTCFDKKMPLSPNVFKEEENKIVTPSSENFLLNLADSASSIQRNNSDAPKILENFFNTPLGLSRCQENRPPNLNLLNVSSDSSNTTLSFTPQFSPTRSPLLPQDINEDSVFDEHSPTPPKYKSPPRGIILDPRTTKMIFLLRQYQLEKYIPTFIHQEVDFDLFLTLTNGDLIELGVDDQSERNILLSLINEYKGK